jgi:hypothetical protein
VLVQSRTTGSDERGELSGDLAITGVERSDRLGALIQQLKPQCGGGINRPARECLDRGDELKDCIEDAAHLAWPSGVPGRAL